MLNDDFQIYREYPRFVSYLLKRVKEIRKELEEASKEERMINLESTDDLIDLYKDTAIFVFYKLTGLQLRVHEKKEDDYREILFFENRKLFWKKGETSLSYSEEDMRSIENMMGNKKVFVDLIGLISEEPALKFILAAKKKTIETCTKNFNRSIVKLLIDDLLLAYILWIYDRREMDYYYEEVKRLLQKVLEKSNYKPDQETIYQVETYELKLQNNMELKILNERFVLYIYYSMLCFIMERALKTMKDCFLNKTTYNGEIEKFEKMFPNKRSIDYILLRKDLVHILKEKDKAKRVLEDFEKFIVYVSDRKKKPLWNEKYEKVLDLVEKSLLPQKKKQISI